MLLASLVVDRFVRGKDLLKAAPVSNPNIVHIRCDDHVYGDVHRLRD